MILNRIAYVSDPVTSVLATLPETARPPAITLFYLFFPVFFRSPPGRMGMIGLQISRNAAWSAELRAEVLSFPGGKHDDKVDALALIGQLLENVLPGRKPRAKGPRAKDRRWLSRRH